MNSAFLHDSVSESKNFLRHWCTRPSPGSMSLHQRPMSAAQASSISGAIRTSLATLRMWRTISPLQKVDCSWLRESTRHSVTAPSRRPPGISNMSGQKMSMSLRQKLKSRGLSSMSRDDWISSSVTTFLHIADMPSSPLLSRRQTIMPPSPLWASGQNFAMSPLQAM